MAAIGIDQLGGAGAKKAGRSLRMLMARQTVEVLVHAYYFLSVRDRGCLNCLKAGTCSNITFSPSG